MQLVVSRMAVPYPKNVALIRLQARKGYLLEVIHDAPFLLRCHLVVWMPGKNASREFPFCVQRVDKGAGGVHIPAQHFRRQLVTARIIGAYKVVRGAVASALTMRKDFHVHGFSGSAFNSRSRLTSAANTSRASALLLWILAQRAIWFRFAPMRASWRTRSFSSGVCRRR